MARNPVGMRFFDDRYTARQIKAMSRYYLGIARHLFIHIPKNGGMSLRTSREIRRKIVIADPHFHKSKDYTMSVATAFPGGVHGNQHARLIDLSPRARANLQAFAFVRNPFSRTYSRFTFKQKKADRRGEAVDYSPAAFERFLEQRHEFGGKPYYWHRAIKGWYNQVDYVRDETGQIAADILRTECLSADLERYLGVQPDEHRNRSGARAPHYTEVYTDRTRQIVADWYADDIETFGFDFTGPATRRVWEGLEA